MLLELVQIVILSVEVFKMLRELIVWHFIWYYTSEALLSLFINDQNFLGSFSILLLISLHIFCLYGSLSKYTHFFLFIFWWHQIFSFPFSFSLLVFPTLQWHIHIICSRKSTTKKNISRYVAPPHTFQFVVLPT
jgi:hypothetical protein